MRKAKVFYQDKLAGLLKETEEGFEFEYDDLYLAHPKAKPISLTLPTQNKIYKNTILFPFFDGLIPEGWLLDIGIKNWKLNSKDRFGLLLTLCEDCIGCVSIKEDVEK